MSGFSKYKEILSSVLTEHPKMSFKEAQKMASEILKKEVPAVKADFILVLDKLPDTKKYSPVTSISKGLIIKRADGTITPGVYVKYERDMNAHHVTAKKGDGFFQTPDDCYITDAVAWKLKNGLN